MLKLVEHPHFPDVRAVSNANAAEDLTQNVATLEQGARACVDPAIQWCLWKFNFGYLTLSQHPRPHESCVQ